MSVERPNRELLTSWKAIAQFFDRDPRTVQRWEKEEGLPIHRHPHRRQSSVYAYRDELDQWWRDRGTLLEFGQPATTEPRDPPAGQRHQGVRWSWSSRATAAAVVALAAGLLVFPRGPRSPDWNSTERVLAALDEPGAEHLRVGPLGDLNGDGRDDAAFSAEPSGEIRVLLGGSVPPSGTLAAAAAVTIRGTDPGAHLAQITHDLEDDGTDDLLVSVFLREPATYTGTGRTYLIRGRAAWPSQMQLPDDADVVFEYSQPHDIRMAVCVPSPALDLNHDGLPDLLFGGGDYSPPGRPSAGGAFVLFGRRDWPAVVDVEREANIAIHGSRSGEALAAECGAGDFDGDGRQDLALVAPEQTLWNMLGGRGRYYLFAGRDGWPALLDTVADADLVVEGRQANSALAPPILADLTGDGRDELVLPLAWMAGGESTGELAVFAGRELSPSEVHSMSRADAVIAFDRPYHGQGTVAVADLDQDQYADMVLVDRAGALLGLPGRPSWPQRVTLEALAPSVVFASPADRSREVRAGDVDGDGLVDLVVTRVSNDGESSLAATLLSAHQRIAMDIRPGAEPNILFHPGILVVRIAGAGLPAAGLDADSVRLAGVVPARHVWRDFDDDGAEDLQLYFETGAMRIDHATPHVALTARTSSGDIVAAVDAVVVLTTGTSPGFSDLNQLPGKGQSGGR